MEEMNLDENITEIIKNQLRISLPALGDDLKGDIEAIIEDAIY